MCHNKASSLEPAVGQQAPIVIMGPKMDIHLSGVHMSYMVIYYNVTFKFYISLKLHQ